MSRTVINFILAFVVLLVAQAVVFNNLVLFNVAVPMVFIYLIISLPMSFSTNVALTIGFLTGLSVDVFSDTQGLNALACTILAFVRKPVFHLYMVRDEDLGGNRPSVSSMGHASFMKYMFTMTLIYCTIVFMVDAFNFFNPLRMLLRIVCSTAFTFVIIYALESLTVKQNEKRL